MRGIVVIPTTLILLVLLVWQHFGFGGICSISSLRDCSWRVKVMSTISLSTSTGSGSRSLRAEPVNAWHSLAIVIGSGVVQTPEGWNFIPGFRNSILSHYGDPGSHLQKLIGWRKRKNHRKQSQSLVWTIPVAHHGSILFTHLKQEKQKWSLFIRNWGREKTWLMGLPGWGVQPERQILIEAGWRIGQ